MRRLIRVVAGRRANVERGAVLVLTAVVVGLVAIGMLALTVDLGNITYNRAELQNGADAASLSLATSCAEASANAPCELNQELRDLAIDNAGAADQSMSIVPLFGDIDPKHIKRTCVGGNPSFTATTLPRCDPPTEDEANLSSCQPWPLDFAYNKVSYVEVTTRTKMQGNDDPLPFFFAPGDGTKSETCSRAAWGPAGSVSATIPIAISQCAYDDATKLKNPTNPYAPAPSPQYDDPAPNPDTQPQPPASVSGYATALRLHAKKVGNCPDTGVNGQTYPGGFGWLQTTDSTHCSADVSIGESNGDTTGGGDGDTGRKPPNACKNNSQLQSYVGTVVGVPIYNGYNDSGAGGTYDISAIAAFYLAGFVKVNTLPDYAVYSRKPACSNCTSSQSDTYLWGWFVDGPVPGGHLDPDAPNFGAQAVVPAG